MKRNSTGFIILLIVLVILLSLGIALLYLGISTGRSIDLRFILRETADLPLIRTCLRF